MKNAGNACAEFCCDKPETQAARSSDLSLSGSPSSRGAGITTGAGTAVADAPKENADAAEDGASSVEANLKGIG